MTGNEVCWGTVIVAAGSGKRFGGDIPKQFMPLLGSRVIDHSLGIFRKLTPIIVVVLPDHPEGTEWWNPPAGIHRVTGGERRQDSVLNGVRRAIELGATHILVHDGARPSIDPATVSRVMDSTIRTGTGLPCIPIRDTIKRTSMGVSIETVDRTDLELAQTPQGFRADLLLRGLENAESVTDEASAVEAIGVRVSVVVGSPRNLKLTDREDRYILESVMTTGETAIGTGLDFHPFTPDRPLVFCGCRLDEKNGLQGHSDGDVVLHAVADAILAASRAGDIGSLFPPEDMKWKNADSSVLLSKCAAKVREMGWAVKSLDVTVIGERPKVSPFRDMFIKRIAEILNIDPGCVWIKGTTTNTIGELARGTGVGCHVLAGLVRLM